MGAAPGTEQGSPAPHRSSRGARSAGRSSSTVSPPVRTPSSWAGPKRLLAAGALPGTESGRGAKGTRLCAAACWGHTETVRALLAHGADPDLREDHGTGRSPLEWAMTGPYPETIAMLLAAGARRHDQAT
ncbi:ankyrin repeat domain-containing protein [Streptomyces shenzhenensis]|uniref:ankyrin repeat domain-containing protein n=1 Tax=Streptomyces shenzhenensis TaxID=943815 RepID=UPI00355733ED